MRNSCGHAWHAARGGQLQLHATTADDREDQSHLHLL